MLVLVEVLKSKAKVSFHLPLTHTLFLTLYFFALASAHTHARSDTRTLSHAHIHSQSKKPVVGTTSILHAADKDTKFYCYLCDDLFVVCSVRDTEEGTKGISGRE